MALAAIMQLFGEAEAACILFVAAIHHVAERLHVLPRIVVEPDPSPGFQIDHGHLLAGAQIVDGFGALFRSHPVSNAAAIAAAVEAQHQTGLFRRTAMHEGIDAERPMRPDQPGLPALQHFEPRPPHQRAIGEDPEFTGTFT